MRAALALAIADVVTYQEAAGRTASLPERQYLTARAAALAGQQENSAGM